MQQEVREQIRYLMASGIFTTDELAWGVRLSPTELLEELKKDPELRKTIQQERVLDKARINRSVLALSEEGCTKQDMVRLEALKWYAASVHDHHPDRHIYRAKIAEDRKKRQLDTVLKAIEVANKYDETTTAKFYDEIIKIKDSL